MKTNIKFNLDFTISKLVAVLMLIIGSTYSFMSEDEIGSRILVETFMYTSLLIGVKTISSISKNKVITNSKNENDA